MAGWDRANGRRRDAAGGGDSGVHGRDLALGPVRLGRGFWLGSGRIVASEIETPSTMYSGRPCVMYVSESGVK